MDPTAYGVSMRVVTNEKLVASRTRWARTLMPVGLVALLTGFVFSLQIGNVQAQIASWVALVIGIFASTIGVNLADKWMSLPQRPRADESLEASLKTLDVRHKLYNWTLPAEHVLLSPTGVTVLLVKKQEGTIQCRNGKWRNKLSPRLWLANISRERLGNPPRELAGEMDRVQTLLKTSVPDLDVPVNGVIVLSNPVAKLEIEDCGDNIATPADLKDKWRVGGSGRRLTDAEFKRVEEALDQTAEPNAQPVPVKPTRRPGAPSPTRTPAKTTTRSTGKTPAASRSRVSVRSRFSKPTRAKPPKPPREPADK